MYRVLISLPLLLAASSNVWGEDVETDPKQAKAARLRLMTRSVTDVRMTVGAKLLAIKKEPLLRWSNAVTKIVDGTVFLWTMNGRPQAAVQVFRVPGDVWLQEFQSLSTDGIVAKRSGESLWNPNKPGIKFREIPKSPQPHSRKVGRLVQMRAIAREFTATDQFEDKEPYELRLMTNPLHRYDDEESGIVDGALFSFAHGTDPEVLLLVEAVKEKSTVEWRVAFAPLTSYAVRVERKGDEFWSCERRPPPNAQTDGFFLHVYKDMGE